MRTGEGKTLVATLPLYLNALTGKGVHLVTVNDYLARRDARWMAPIYNMLGLSVGVLQMAARTESGKKGFLVDLKRQSPHEDQDQLEMISRKEAYAADITYGTNNEFGFDYLRDNMAMRLEDRVQRDFYYAIIDEVDNVLIDEARTPLIISGPAHDDTEWYLRMAQIVKKLQPEDYEINEKDRSVFLTEIGESRTEDLLGIELRDPDRPEDVTPEQARLIGYLEQALRSQFLFRRNKDYLVQAGKVVIIDEFTGRLMPGRRWSDGLHQAVEAKEGVKVQSESVTYATVTIQNYFRMYEMLSGMTGTALTEAEEFDTIYQLDVLAIPTNLEYIASLPNSDLEELVGTDDFGYKYRFYAHPDDPEQNELFWKRKDYPDVVYRTEEAKLRAITQEILRYHSLGKPMLVGTTSVELSDRVSSRLRAEPLRRLAQVLLIRDTWIEQNYGEHDGRVIPELQFLNNPLDKIQTAELRKMARELNIPLNPADPINAGRMISILNNTDNNKERLINILQAGIPHQVLNARKHTEESQIIAGAGAFGAVTIATNMAGRGVDIKLGGELAEEIIFSVNRVLKRSGNKNPFEMTMEERRQALLSLKQADYGIYETEINFYLQHMNEMEQVRKLGGLHVIGSERHEARRIDNQLRGRSARQGDPGSSRFYLSMEDELMRLFGGQQADGLMQRMKIDDAMPLEVGLVGRLIEQSQTRVEGANFDVRKHLLEYDDVLNTQRVKIYSQRNRIFTKEDLHDDVTEMLNAEVERRVPEAFEDEEGPWKLLAWLDQIQPPISGNGTVFPPFSLQLLVDDLINRLPANFDQQAVNSALLEVTRSAVEAEKHQLLKTVDIILDQTYDRFETQLSERVETLDTFFEGLTFIDETDNRRPAEILADLSRAVSMPVKLSANEQRELMDDPDQIYGIVHDQIEIKLYQQTATRLVGAIERRLEDSLGINTKEIENQDWDDLADQILTAVNSIADRRMVRLLGEDGQITKDLKTALSRITGPLTEQHLLQLLLLLPQGARTVFDKKTHRRVQQQTIRLTYVYYAANFLENREQEEITAMVSDHLENAQIFMGELWGAAELGRLANSNMADLDHTTIDNLYSILGDETYKQYANQALTSLPQEFTQAIVSMLGRRALSEIYRQLLLSIITEQWVEYLTQMEALRVSIGLEAYARQDPLVQYKNRAFEFFQNLMSNMRIMVVTRMFTYRPRDISSVEQRKADHNLHQGNKLKRQRNAGGAGDVNEHVFKRFFLN
jgi:preprotein translocase subunit SecA